MHAGRLLCVRSVTAVARFFAFFFCGWRQFSGRSLFTADFGFDSSAAVHPRAGLRGVRVTEVGEV
jgi:hypothetical protein